MDWKEKFNELKSKLETERDELRVKAKLASMDARDELDGLDGKWALLNEKFSEMELSDVTEEAKETAEELAEELKEGYAKLKERIG